MRGILSDLDAMRHQANSVISYHSGVAPMISARATLVGGILRGFGAKLLVLPFAAVATLTLARLVSAHLGIETFAWYALISGLPLLFPFLDFGMGAALASAGALASTSSSKQAEFSWLVRRTFSIAVLIALGLSAVSLALGASGLWTKLVGIPDQDLNWPISIALATFAFSIPGSLSYSILLGLGRNGLSVVIQGLTPVVSLAIISAALALGAGTDAVISLACAGPLLATCIAFLVAKTFIRRPGPLTETPANRPRILNTAGPMIFLMLTGATYLHSGRLVVAHLGDTEDLATFAASWIVFQPLWSVIQTAARSLWPHFTRARQSSGLLPNGFGTAFAMTSTLGLVLGIALITLGPALANFATSGKAEMDMWLFIGLAGVLLLQGMQAPAGMYLTDPRGLWWQVFCSIFSAVTALAFSIGAFDLLGPTSVGLGLSLGLLAFQVIPLNVAATVAISQKGTKTRG